MENFPKCGFLVFRKVLSIEEIEFARNTIKDGRVDYYKVGQFIEECMFKVLRKNLQWNPVYTKYRMSDNNNSTDAAALHRDVIKRSGKIFPFFTVLAYLDKTVMEMIPFSHTKTMSVIDGIKSFNDKIKLDIYPGDILIFHSSLIHRGIFTENLPHRRLLQVFEVYPSMDLYRQFSERVYHIPKNDNETVAKRMKSISKIPYLIDVCNIVSYLNAATGYGYPYRDDRYDYLSSDAACKRVVPKYIYGRNNYTEDYRELNVYIYRDCPNDIDDREVDNLRYHLFTLPIIKIIIVNLILILLLIYIILSYKNNYNSK